MRVSLAKDHIEFTIEDRCGRSAFGAGRSSVIPTAASQNLNPPQQYHMKPVVCFRECWHRLCLSMLQQNQSPLWARLASHRRDPG